MVENNVMQSNRELCGLIADLSQHIESHIRKVAEELDLTMTQAIAIRELNEPMTLSDLAKKMCCEASNATFVADKLEALGYMRRVPHETDRRAKIITLTESGKNQRDILLNKLVKNSPLDVLSSTEQNALKTIIKSIIHAT